MPSAFLENQSHFTVEGDDAEDFLQNLITTDLEGLVSGISAPGALLTPQGKILFFFMISRADSGFSIEIDRESADGLVKRLSMYKLRAKVDIGAIDAIGTGLFWGGDAGTAGLQDIRFNKAGVSLVRRAGSGAMDNPAPYDALRTELVIPEPGKDFALGDAFPHDVMLDLTGGVSFKKGCYVGQEVVSRMQHRATARRRPVRVSAEGPLPDTGTQILVGGKPVGALGTVADRSGIAVVRIDKVGAALAAKTPIMAGDQAVQIELASWSGLSFPQDAAED